MSKKNKRKFFKENYIFLTESFWQKIPLLWLCALTFILVATNIFVSNPDSFPRVDTFQVTTAPVPQTAIGKAPAVSAASAIIYDPNSSVVLFEENADTPLPPASTTKIATALVALGSYGLQDILSIDPGSVEIDGQTMKLLAGERITVEGLVNGLLIFSANDAAEVLASNYPGGKEKFIAEMNVMVEALNLTNTHFKNPSGLFEDGHFSSARDLARLAAFAMNNPVLSEIFKTRERTVVSTNGANVHKLTNLNQLLWDIPGVLGIKTGKTEEGGEALVTFITRDDNPLIIVVLGSVDRFSDTRSLIDWAYENYEWASPITARSSQ